MNEARLHLPANQPGSRLLSVAAQAVSVLAHPLFIPALVAAMLLYWHPISCLLLPPSMRVRMMAMVVVNTIMFPGLLLLLLWRLGFVKSIAMRTQRERYIPLAASLLFYFWAYYVSRSIDGVPPAFLQWMLGVFLCGCAAEFTNIFKKISLHMIGMGGVVAFLAWQQAVDAHWPGFSAPLALVLAGLVGSARLIKNAHSPSQVYAGFLAGLICQLAAGVMVG
jgi:hypothetical protein